MDTIDPLIDLCFGHGGEVSVDGSGGGRGMTEIDLDDPQIYPCFQQMRGVREWRKVWTEAALFMPLSRSAALKAF